MNVELQKIICDFQEKVEQANELLKKYLETDEPHNRGAHVEQVGILAGKYKYFFHGVGCTLHISEEDIIEVLTRAAVSKKLTKT